MPLAAPPTPLTVALIGNPNTGKSTLFGALAGVQTRVGNFPGVTVEKKIGRFRHDGRVVSLIDLPGAYSLSPRSPDEMVAVDVLLGRQRDVPPPDAVVCIVDAANLERNLYLVSQVLDIGLPTVVVLNMTDVARRRGIEIDVAALSERLGIPVVPTEAHRRIGVEDVRRAVVEVAAVLRPSEAVEWSGNRSGGLGRRSYQTDRRRNGPIPRIFPEEFYAECESLAERLRSDGDGEAPPQPTQKSGFSEKAGLLDVPPYLLERMLLDVGGRVETEFARRCTFDLSAWLAAARSRLAESGCRVPAVEARVRYEWIRGLLDGVVTRPRERRATLSDRVDRLLTHRFAGLVIFAAMMFVVFQAIYSWAEPAMEAIGAGQAFLAGQVETVLAPGPFRSLVVDGAIAGVGGVLVFLPQICLLFLFIAVLEDCGYMARAAFLMDRLMSRIGLSGKSFVPLMSSFACAIPGVMATRVIENRRDRMVTILIAPLMSCSARLPVYLLLIAAFIPAESYAGGWITLQGLVLFGMTALGAVVAVPVAVILGKTFFKGETPPFVMELPSYKWPSPRIVLGRVYDRSKAFVVRAGTLIFAAAIVVWAAGYFPADHSRLDAVTAEIESLAAQPAADKSATTSTRLDELAEERNRLSSRLVESSFLGRAGHAVEPAVRPLGWDWRIGVGAIASFPAREVIIATLGTIYSLGGDVDEEDAGLKEAIRQAKWPDGTPVYNVPVALSIMVFFALCCQCASTLMVIRRETNSWRWPIFTFTYMTVLAYIGALITYQVGMLFV